MKMYIMINNDVVPKNMVGVVCAHASLACYLKFEHLTPMKKWLETSFKKVVCMVNEEEFRELTNKDSIKYIDKFNVTTESSLDNKQVAITYCPRKHNYPKHFKEYKLWNIEN